MKTTLLLLALILVGCTPQNPVYVGPQRIMESRDIDEYYYKGHCYLKTGYAMVHAEHCQCKTLWVTNVNLNNEFLRMMVPVVTNNVP